MSQIRKEIQEVTGKKQKPGESDVQFAVRVATYINSKVADEDWRRFSETPTQYWVNDVLEFADLNEQNKGGDKGLEEAFSKPRSRNKSSVPSILEELGSAGKVVEGECQKPAKRAKGKQAKREGAVDGKRGRPGNFSLDQSINILVSENPKRKGSASAKHFDLLKDKMRVGDAISAGIPRASLRSWLTCKYIEIH